jgi:hypothetical protein
VPLRRRASVQRNLSMLADGRVAYLLRKPRAQRRDASRDARQRNLSRLARADSSAPVSITKAPVSGVFGPRSPLTQPWCHLPRGRGNRCDADVAAREEEEEARKRADGMPRSRGERRNYVAERVAEHDKRRSAGGASPRTSLGDGVVKPVGSRRSSGPSFGDHGGWILALPLRWAAGDRR